MVKILFDTSVLVAAILVKQHDPQKLIQYYIELQQQYKQRKHKLNSQQPSYCLIMIALLMGG